MAISIPAPIEESERERGVTSRYSGSSSSLASAVSWGAIGAGAAAAAALSLILLFLGVGLGLSSVSPWHHDGVSATTFGLSTILWLTLTQLIAFALGGYLAGRLRTKWTEVPRDEVYFRDTAHGFLSWAVASLASAALMASVIGSIVGGGVQAGASVVGGVASATAAAGGAAASGKMTSGAEGGPMAYFVDSLFRRDASAAPTDSTGSAANVSESTTTTDALEVGRIFTNASLSDPLPPEDIRYVAQLVAQRTGLSQQDAEKRVSDTYARAQAAVRDAEVAAREVADTARKASAYGALWLFVSLLIGAFAASLAATFGGRQRDA